MRLYEAFRWPRRHKYYANASHLYIVCLSVSQGKQRSLFAPTDIHKTSCNVQQLSVQRAIANLLFTVQDGQFRISDTVSCSVTGIWYQQIIATRSCEPSSWLWHSRSLFCFTVTSAVSINSQGRINLFGAPRQWKHFRPLFQAVFLSGRGYYPPRLSQTPRLPDPRQK